MKRKLPILIVMVVLLAGGIYWVVSQKGRDAVATGIVTTDSVIVSAEVQGRLQKLLVSQGDTVKAGQLLAVIQPQEWTADMEFYANTEKQTESQVTQAEAELKYQEAQVTNQVRQAEANLASAQAQVTEGEADLEDQRLTLKRIENLSEQGVESAQARDRARTGFNSGTAKVEALKKLALAAEAAVALAKANADQVAARRAALAAMTHQRAAAGAQKEKAVTRLGYTEIRAPIDGFVDVRAALQGEVVNPGQAIVTLINPDDLRVRCDVEEGLIDRIHLGDKLKVRLPSGGQREGTVYYRAVDADFATQRDVSRTKRDIKTFEIRLRCDNKDRDLAVGMSAYISLPQYAGTTAH